MWSENVHQLNITNDLFVCGQMLETLLPPRKNDDIPVGEHVEEVMLSDYEPRRDGAGGAGRRGEAYDEDEDEDDEMGGGGTRMQCAQQ